MPPSSFQLAILPANTSLTCALVSEVTELDGFTATATPSMAKGKVSRPYLVTSLSLRARPVLPICTRPSPTFCTPTPEPPPATVMRMSPLALMMACAAFFITGMCAVPPAISSVPFWPLKESRGAATARDALSSTSANAERIRFMLTSRRRRHLSGTVKHRRDRRRTPLRKTGKTHLVSAYECVRCS